MYIYRICLITAMPKKVKFMSKRNPWLFWLSILGVGAAVLIQNQWFSMAIVVVCALASLIILYRHLPQLSNISEDNPKEKTLRWVTTFNVLLLLSLVLLVVLLEREILVLSEKQFSYLMPAFFSLIILVFGNVSPKIPHNRYTGLRLPWTVRDEETWLLAHRILGYLSLPCGILCWAGIGSVQLSFTIAMAMLLIWILIPSVLSLIFYYRKWFGK